jgi:hypothetical protein
MVVSMNNTIGNIFLQSDSQWSTDDWLTTPPAEISIQHPYADMESEGGLWRGCGFQTVWNVGVPNTIITITMTWNWSDKAPTTTCTSSAPNLYGCFRDDAGVIGWHIYQA